MKNTQKNQTTDHAQFDAIEQQVKTRMKDIAKIKDAGEKLLAYKTLRDQCYAMADFSKGMKDGQSLRKRHIYLGYCVPVGGIGIFACLTPVLILMPSLPLALASTALGYLGGAAMERVINASTWAQKRSRKWLAKKPADVRHASNMVELVQEVNVRLNSLEMPENAAALMQSARADEVKLNFPHLEEYFDRAAARKTFAASVAKPALPPAPQKPQPSAV